MSPRDFYWFMAGSVIALTSAFTLQPAPAAQAPPPTAPAHAPHTSIEAPLRLDENDVRAARLIVEQGASAPPGGSAGSLEEVTSRLAARLAASGGTSDDWRLLAQSYEYLGRTPQAQEARSHIAPP
jgi:hypothetical protein